MGRSARPRPKRMPRKLRHIREALGLSQNEMLARLGLKGKMLRAVVSGWELGAVEPPLPVILRYARAAGLSTDVLIDDELDLPAKLPAKPKRCR